MKRPFIADLHIHSRYSRATSRELTLENLYVEAVKKGINVVATGDITHPGWIKELKDKLSPVEEGFFKLKDEVESRIKDKLRGYELLEVRFILSGEISNIYSKGGKLRKIHNLVIFPRLEDVESLSKRLSKLGNIEADGRPILGFDCKELLEICLEINPEVIFIPAHIWTPWFSLFGSNSGFDSVVDCFEEMTKYIYTVETGLSSDPPMNWRLTQLDQFVLVSNSDAHSLDKLGREANIFEGEFSYYGILDSLKNKRNYKGTIEFFPEEGKYHYDGHRRCGVRLSPKETLECGGKCPVCGEKLTLGVMYRVEQLADRDPKEVDPEKFFPFVSLIPLKEILAECFEVNVKSKKVEDLYTRLLRTFGNELKILREIDLSDIERVGGELVREALLRMRQGKVYIEPGYDGEYGVVKIFTPQERKTILGQKGFLFFEKREEGFKSKEDKNRLLLQSNSKVQKDKELPKEKETKEVIFTDEQANVVYSPLKCQLVIAGPGTGKTFTLVYRIKTIIEREKVDPSEVLVLTFTRKASRELQERLSKILKESNLCIQNFTFHGFGYWLIKKYFDRVGFVNEPILLPISYFEEQLNQLKKEYPIKERGSTLYKAILKYKMGEFEQIHKEKYWNNFFQNFIGFQKRLALLDYMDLLYYGSILLNDASILSTLNIKALFVDEFQDINKLQYEIIKVIGKKVEYLTIIGDPNQAIYGFRGGSNRFFEEIKRDFPYIEIFRLTENFRSEKIIVQASKEIVSYNVKIDNVEEKELSRLKIKLISFPTARSEGIGIAHLVEELVGGGSFFSVDIGRGFSKEEEIHLKDIAILGRTREVLKEVESALKVSGLPFKSYTERSLIEKEEYRDIIILLLKSCFELEAIKDFRKEFDKFIPLLKSLQPEEKLKKGVELLGLDNEVEELLIDDFKSSGKPFEQWLKDIWFYQDIDIKRDGDYIQLMTLHASKGLEFKVVIICGCEDGIIPLDQFYLDVDLEEEKRLFYVGVTRAKKYLYLSYAKKRMVKGKEKVMSPSPYLKLIEPYLEIVSHQFYHKGSKQLTLF